MREVTRAALSAIIAMAMMTGCSGEDETANNNSGKTTPPPSTQPPVVTTPPIQTTPPVFTTPPIGDDMGNPPPPMFDMNPTPSDMGGADMGPADMSSADMGALDMSGVDMTPMLSCGNGKLDPGETCDGDCSTDCNDNSSCTMDSISGEASMCNVVCTNVEVNSSCGPADGCCPAGCTMTDDADCTIDCQDPGSWPVAWKGFEDEVMMRVNALRAAGGDCGNMMSYPPQTAALTLNPKLQQAARCHAYDMIQRGYFGSADPEGVRVGDRAQAVGYVYSSIGQDTGAGRTSPQAMVDHWMTREGSCNHILSASYLESGVGYSFDGTSQYQHYWVQVVATP